MSFFRRTPVEDYHTYYVGKSELLVHNTCGDDPEDKLKYEKAPYHNRGNSIKNAAPKDGQGALDNSIPIGDTTSRRIGISSEEFVVFDETSPGVFHGHVRTWDELTNTMKSIFIKSGKVTKKGRIK